MERPMNLLALYMGSEQYVFLYEDESIGALLDTFARYAADPDLSFSSHDAAILSQKLRRMPDEHQQPLPNDSMGQSEDECDE